MALIEGTTGITKGTAAALTLNKATLFALAPVLADAYFSVQANVEKVRVIYRSTLGNQQKIVSFELSQATPTSNVFFSLKARNAFEIYKIILQDYDEGLLVLQGNDIPAGLGITL